MANSEKVNAELWAEDKAKSMQKAQGIKSGGLHLAARYSEVACDTAYTATWAYQQRRFPDVTPRLKELLSGVK